MSLLYSEKKKYIFDELKTEKSYSEKIFFQLLIIFLFKTFALVKLDFLFESDGQLRTGGGGAK